MTPQTPFDPAASASRPLRFAALLSALALGLSACEPRPETNPPYEVWALDQGLGTVHVLRDGEEEVAKIDLRAHELPGTDARIAVPHMIDFTSDGRFGFVASTGGAGHVTVIRAADRKVLAVFETGAGTHMAAVTPDDSAAIVAVLSKGELQEIKIDKAAETFTRGRTLKIAEDPLFAARASEFPAARPVCHEYTRDGQHAYVTLGPGHGDGGLVIVDVREFKLVKVFPPSEVPANCGTLLAPDGKHMVVNGGKPDTVADGHAHAGVGEWFVFDTTDHTLVKRESSRGSDAHGVALARGSSELWMVNRSTSNAIVIDPVSFEVIEEVAEVGKSPDILVASPLGDLLYVTLRGPEPLSGTHAIAGETSGVSVIDVATRKVVKLLRPSGDDPKSDFHGIGLRLVEEAR